MLKLIKHKVSNILLAREGNSVKLINYFGIQAYAFVNQKSTQKMRYGIYEEAAEIHFLKSQFLESDVFLDIGANMGFYTLLAAKYTNKVVAIEPIRKNVALINLSLALTDTKSVIVHQKLASDEETQYNFLEVQQTGLSRVLTDNLSLMKSHVQQEYGVSIDRVSERDSITIDSLQLDKLDIIKIDVEGFELKALFGSIETLKRCRPRLLMVEVAEEAMSLQGVRKSQLITFLKSLDYSAKVLINGSLIPFVGQNIPNDNLFFTNNR